MGFYIHGNAQTETHDKLKGIWRSINRPDTLTIKFVDGKTVYFNTESMAAFNGKSFTYYIYKIDSQFMLLLTPPGSKTDMKLMLWLDNAYEIKLQGVDLQDYDNPTAHKAPQTNQNTFILKRIVK